MQHPSLPLNPGLARLTDYPFDRLRSLLDGVSPPDNMDPLTLSIGEPKHSPPDTITDTLNANKDLWGRYPPIDGTPELRAAIAGWMQRRFNLPDDAIDADAQILPVIGTREALFMAALLAVADDDATVLFPNPMYHVYAGAAALAGAEAVALEATAANGFLPDLEAIDEQILSRCALMYLCTPSNPEGAVASKSYISRAIDLARTHRFVLAMDECYSEIYDREPPAGAAEVCSEDGGNFDNVLIFQSLSKRSSAPGLRSGFVAGDASLIARFRLFRNYGAATMPLPIMAASTALWSDDAHVAENRALYQAKFDLAERLLGTRFGFKRPAGGFFLWLDVSEYGGGEVVAKRLWAEAALRVLPGAFLSRVAEDGTSPGDDFIRLALVHSPDVTEDALNRVLKVLR
ncbi:MAG: aminotransferase class I/II-fold pyridoxal phosphate-dependent enzyme [Rhodospirillaceae bacterium]|jgi:N-succinyldiaminopimelate aminotransferase|nr:aminotransferase class I/II-fold pyridoxal phosphate-dependent enzyme [Rhodospirillaceae bacterium]MBT5014653.1 aminotransferase class I/II-fold pyridoxal phosphate-dependent enzyme [Rhodospirillaceae bacterium]MBT5309396.1 aminotransferase class I/II-fold pyridoxal phosphate-dependent enzyme [Rhodospirillaceae bacterium]MBT6406819.1 aminotransferase class I/II-fold pyridoxal phosphate-dependent enzyme [Rhodospirillaceae bacterium]MBT7356589.1 aminotransferase class I/II-fold pyridoxal phosp